MSEAVEANIARNDSPTEEQQQQQEGVSANKGGYCFGKDSVLKAIAAVARGEMVVVVLDDMNVKMKAILLWRLISVPTSTWPVLYGIRRELSVSPRKVIVWMR